MAIDVDRIARLVREELGSGLRGEVVFPGDRGYDTARAVFNGMIDRRPLAVIRSLDASDVVRCITFARRLDLPLSVRGGGHSVAGNAVTVRNETHNGTLGAGASTTFGFTGTGAGAVPTDIACS